MLGSFIDETAPADKSLSGVELLPDSDSAFRTRFAIAGLAEKTLDLQYYLWKGDLADNAVAVLGGRNIGNDYFGVDTNANFFDLDVLTVGEGARQAGAAFDEYWNSKNAVPSVVLNKRVFTPQELAAARERLRESLKKLNALPFVVTMESDKTLENLKQGETI